MNEVQKRIDKLLDRFSNEVITDVDLQAAIVELRTLKALVKHLFETNLTEEDNLGFNDLRAAQIKHCKDLRVTRWAPYDGICPKCRKQIYDVLTLEECSSEVIVNCPYCNADFTT